uniref:Pancreatic trypsin inhibitor n=1 Tax=Rhipicephalus zambeziensis TaxID=60191 RepID=A0A224YBD9_9ACAR
MNSTTLILCEVIILALLHSSQGGMKCTESCTRPPSCTRQTARTNIKVHYFPESKKCVEFTGCKGNGKFPDTLERCRKCCKSYLQ